MNLAEIKEELKKINEEENELRIECRDYIIQFMRKKRSGYADLSMVTDEEANNIVGVGIDGTSITLDDPEYCPIDDVDIPLTALIRICELISRPEVWKN